MRIPYYHLSAAVALARPGARFSINPEEGGYDAICMLPGEDGVTPEKPTVAEIEAAWTNRPRSDVPEAVLAHQLKIWLARKGLIDAVKRVINGLPEEGGHRVEAQIRWAEAPTIRRDHFMVAALGAALNMTDAQLDQAFIEMAQIP